MRRPSLIVIVCKLALPPEVAPRILEQKDSVTKNFLNFKHSISMVADQAYAVLVWDYLGSYCH